MSSTSVGAVDVLIIGGGPSGLATALCLSRARYRTAVFDSGVYRNGQSSHMHMVPTWDHRDPKEYRAEARKELRTRYGDIVDFVDHAVTSVTKDEVGNFTAIDATGKSWTGRKLVLAIGVKDVLPDIPGYADCWVKGIFHCLFCHGYEDRDVKSIGVLAIDLMAQVPQITNGLARNALQFSKDVTVYTNGSATVETALTPLISTVANNTIKIDQRQIARLTKEKTGPDVTIEFADGEKVTHGFLVHGPRNEINLDFAKGLKLEKVPPLNGELKLTSPFQETTEPGCFAVGDIGTIGKMVNAGVTYGGFAAMGIVKQLQGY